MDLAATPTAGAKSQPDEITNIYAALTYLVREADRHNLVQTKAILQGCSEQIRRLCLGKHKSSKELEVWADDLFIAFYLLLKYLTSGTEKEKKEFISFLNGMPSMQEIRVPQKPS